MLESNSIPGPGSQGVCGPHKKEVLRVTAMTTPREVDRPFLDRLITDLDMY